MQNLAVKEEISECRTSLGEFRMLVKFVRNTRECVQLGRNFGSAKHLQQMLAVLRRDGHIRQTAENHGRRVACSDMSNGAGVAYRGFVASGRHQRLCDVPDVCLWIKRHASGELYASTSDSGGFRKELDLP
jgi:hypothetical protein